MARYSQGRPRLMQAGFTNPTQMTPAFNSLMQKPRQRLTATPRYGDYGERGPVSATGQGELDADVAAMDARWSAERQAELGALQGQQRQSAFATSAIESGDRAAQELHDQTMMGRELLVNAPTRTSIERSGNILAQGQAATQAGLNAANPAAAGIRARENINASAAMVTPRPPAVAAPPLGAQPIPWQGETMKGIAGQTANVAEADAHVRRSQALRAQAAALDPNSAAYYMENSKLMDEAGREAQVAEALRTGMTLPPELITQRQRIGYRPDTGAVVPAGMPGAGHYIGGVQATPEERVARGETVNPAIINRRAAEEAERQAGLAETEERRQRFMAAGVTSTAQADVERIKAETLGRMTQEERVQLMSAGSGQELGAAAAEKYMALAKQAREEGNEEMAKWYEEKAATVTGGAVVTEQNPARQYGGIGGAIGAGAGYLWRGALPPKRSIVPRPPAGAGERPRLTAPQPAGRAATPAMRVPPQQPGQTGWNMLRGVSMTPPPMPGPAGAALSGAPGQKLPNGLVAATLEETMAVAQQVGGDPAAIEAALNQQGKTARFTPVGG